MNKTTVAQQDKPVRHLRSVESISLLSGRVSSRPFVGSTLQMKPICACGGGCPRCTSKIGSANAMAEQLRSPAVAPPTSGRADHLLQAKLSMGASHDPLEQEADRVADQVMAAPAHSAVSGVPPHIQRFMGQATGQTGTAPASVDRVLSSSGRPLEPALQHDMEQRFGHNFSRVRVHSGAAAEQSARDVNAHAYTVGHNMVFDAGRFAPGTHEGRRLIAHELTHVVQQGRAVTASVIQRQPAAGGNAVAQDAAQTVNEEKKDETSPCPSWFRDGESLSKRAAEEYVRNDLTPLSQGTVQKIECEKPFSNGNYGCYVHFSDGLVIRVIVRRQDVVVGVPPITTLTPPADRPLCFYDYSCPEGQLVLSKRECKSGGKKKVS